MVGLSTVADVVWLQEAQNEPTTIRRRFANVIYILVMRFGERGPDAAKLALCLHITAASVALLRLKPHNCASMIAGAISSAIGI